MTVRLNKYYPLFPVLFCAILFCSSCKVFHLGKYKVEKQGCPVGKNIGAEKLLSSDPKYTRAIKKASKDNKKLNKDLYHQ
jgi:hypothetical protein